MIFVYSSNAPFKSPLILFIYLFNIFFTIIYIHIIINFLKNINT